MGDLPNNLIYFASLADITEALNKQALPLKEANDLGDPFLADKNTPMPFNLQQLFNAAIKYIGHAVLGKRPPKGQPNHPLQKAMMRWRMESRFNDESEIKGALQGLLPAMVEKAFEQAKEMHQDWTSYVNSKRLVSFYQKFGDLELWQQQGFNHHGAAIKFKLAEGSILEKAKPVNYSKIPVATVSLTDFVEHMVGVLPNIEFEPEKSLLAKNYNQRHLKEWRLLVDHNEHPKQGVEFDPLQIQSVYLGALVPEQTCEQFVQLMKRLCPQANVYRARCKAREYALEFDKVSQEPPAG